ncbi:MAG: mechanosensitive ion channel family protein [Treponema sp.]|nr:mechanosensitive ion channel family protein [Treponema sp.]
MEETLSQTVTQGNSIADAAVEAATQTFGNQINGVWDWIKSNITFGNLFKVIGTLLVILVIFFAYKLITRGIKKVPVSKMPVQRSTLIIRLVKYLFYIIVLMYVLSVFGIKLNAILGAAGIAGVAIGFAAQTSVSNLISGLFVITEGAIKIDDTVTVDGVTGIVDSINLLSIRIHTFDNQMVRVPNSTVINSTFTNISYHPKRRLTVNVSMDYNADMRTALEALQKAPSLCPTVVSDPAPAVWFDGFGDSGINLTVAAWFKSADFLQTKNDLHIAIKTVLDEAGISIPFNQLDVKIKADDEAALPVNS